MNREELDLTLKHIEFVENGDRLRMSCWGISNKELSGVSDEVRTASLLTERNECGTSACLAGWACVTNGYTMVFDETDYGFLQARCLTTGEAIEDVAVELLDLSFDEKELLFYRPTSVEEVRQMADRIEEVGAKQVWAEICSEEPDEDDDEPAWDED